MGFTSLNSFCADLLLRAWAFSVSAILHIRNVTRHRRVFYRYIRCLGCVRSYALSARADDIETYA